METAIGAASWLVGKVLNKLSDDLVSAYVASSELGLNYDLINTNLLHMQALLHASQNKDVSSDHGLRGMLEKLAKKADEAEDALDELHYFIIQDQLDGTREAAPDLGDGLRDYALHGRHAARHTIGNWLPCFSCSRTQDADFAAGNPHSVTQCDSGNDGGHVGKLKFDRVAMSNKIKSVIEGIHNLCDPVSNLLNIKILNSNSTVVTIKRSPTGSTVSQDELFGRSAILKQTVDALTGSTYQTETLSVLPIVGPGELDGTVLLHSVQNLRIKELRITGELFSKALRSFPALSKLDVSWCGNLELLPVEDGGLSDLRMLQSFNGYYCGKLFSRWHMGEVGGGGHAIKPFPTCLRELKILFEPSMQSMGLLSNLTSLTSLILTDCRELTMDGFNPLITVNLKKLCVQNEKGISIAGDLLSEIARSKLMRAGSFQLEKLWVDSISAVLTAPICSHLAATLHTLEFSHDQSATTFTEEQERALLLLTALQHLAFYGCKNLQSLPRGLRGLSSLKGLGIFWCKKILSLPPKEGLPTSLEELEVWDPELTEQAIKLKVADPWFSVIIV
ncbi:hypothetical protein ACQ4PT_064349 [Festuca glaucescens]